MSEFEEATPEGWETSMEEGLTAIEHQQYEIAEQWIEISVQIAETFGPDDPRLATSLRELARLYLGQERHFDCEGLFRRLLSIEEKTLGPEHPDVIACVRQIGRLAEQQGNVREALKCFERALEVEERTLGREHPRVLQVMNDLSALYRRQGRIEDADPLDMDLATRLQAVAESFRAQGRSKDAADAESTMEIVRARTFGS